MLFKTPPTSHFYFMSINVWMKPTTTHTHPSMNEDRRAMRKPPDVQIQQVKMCAVDFHIESAKPQT